MTNRRFRWYWFPRVNFGVTFHLLHDWRSRWNRVIGIQVGTTFIGIVRSEGDFLKTERG